MSGDSPPPRGRGDRATRRAAVAVVAIATLAALTLVGRSAGLGVTVALVAVYGAAARRRPVWWALAAALAAVAAVRDAAWVLVPSLVASVAVASYAATGGTAWRQVALGLVRVPALPRAGVGVLTRLPRVGAAGLRAAGIAIVLLAVFVPLFATADAAFAHMLDALVPQESVDHPAGRVVLWIGMVTLGGALMQAAPVRPAHAPRRTLARVEWALPLSMLVALFAAFVALQLTALFGGNDYVLETANLSYADYARSGFAQLIAAAALTLAVIAAAVRYAPPATLRTALLGALAALTLVVLASAYKRLHLYEDAYGFTRLRLAADAAIVWLAALFALVLIVRNAAWLPRGVLALSATGVLAFALSNPDGRIAERNIDRYERTGRIDRDVLRGLSADAARALPPELARCPPPDSLVSVNLARSRARARCAD